MLLDEFIHLFNQTTKEVGISAGVVRRDLNLDSLDITCTVGFSREPIEHSTVSRWKQPISYGEMEWIWSSIDTARSMRGDEIVLSEIVGPNAKIEDGSIWLEIETGLRLSLRDLPKGTTFNLNSWLELVRPARLELLPFIPAPPNYPYPQFPQASRHNIQFIYESRDQTDWVRHYLAEIQLEYTRQFQLTNAPKLYEPNEVTKVLRLDLGAWLNQLSEMMAVMESAADKVIIYPG